MATNMIGTHSVANFVNSKRAVADGGGDASGLTSGVSNYVTHASIDARLTAYDAFTYSAANLQLLSYNDKVYALRAIDDPTTISNYYPTQVARTS